MAAHSVLVEDCSAMIQYTPPEAWQDAPANDTLAASYSGASYHVTSTRGASAAFQFRGTGFTITGGRRPGYGPFSVSLDGKQLFEGNPVAESSPIKNTLASVTGLPVDTHTIVLTNTGGAPVDIDSITFQAQIGSAGSNLAVTTYDDNDPRIQYTPSSDAWKLNSRPEFQDGTLHFSEDPNAAVSMQFTGNAVGVYGTVAPDHADISITIDGRTVTMPGGSGSRVVAVRTGVLMYWADNLADGQHNLTVSKVQSDSTGPFIDIDFFDVFSAAASSTSGTSTSGSGSPLPPAGPTNKPKQAAAPTGVIAGVSVAVAAVLLLICVGLFLLFRLRRRRKKLKTTKSEISPITPILPMQGVEPGGRASPFPFPPPASLAPLRKPHYNKRLSRLSVAPSYYGDPDFSNSLGEGSSSGSLYPSVPPVPRLNMSRIPESPRIAPVVTDTTPSPFQSPRPSRPRRPPTLNIGSLR